MNVMKESLDSRHFFDPKKELDSVKKLPTQERKEAYDEWKKRYLDQRMALAQFQSDLVKYVKNKPDATREELCARVSTVSSYNEFTTEQTDKAHSIIDEYIDRRQCIREIREKYPDDDTLYHELLGFSPRGNIEIDEGPLSFKVTFGNSVDMVRAYNNNPPFGKLILKLLANKVSPVAGFARDANAPELSHYSGIVTAVMKDASAPLGRAPITADELALHEEQHALYALMQMGKDSLDIKIGLLAEHAPEEVINALFSTYKNFIEDETKNELLANLRVERIDAMRMRDLTGSYIPSSINNACDHLRDSLASEKLPESLQKQVPHIERAVRQRLKSRDFVDQMAQETIRAVGAFERLTRDSELTVEKGVSLLMWEPLSSWEKLVDRIEARRGVTAT